MTHLSCRVGRLSAGCILALVLLHLPTVLRRQGIPKFDLAAGPLELSGPANPWRFVNAVGEKAEYGDSKRKPRGLGFTP